MRAEFETVRIVSSGHVVDAGLKLDVSFLGEKKKQSSSSGVQVNNVGTEQECIGWEHGIWRQTMS